MLNVAMLSKWHVHAEGYANQVVNTGKARITAVWDEDANRGSEWAKQLGCDFVQDLDSLLSRDDVDAVICDAPTTMHRDVMVKAALAGKHIFTEKAMAPTVAECEDIARAVEQTGVTFVISLPQRTSPVIQLARQLIKNNEFGKISLVRIRNGHDGVSAGWLPKYWFDESMAAGGALMDLGCHPMYTACYLLGKPVRIASLLTAPFGSKVDESATASIEFENGAVCTCETSFISYNTPGAVEIYGSEATLLAYGGDVRLKTKNLGKYTDEYIVPKLPKALPAPIEMFVDACLNKTGSPEGFGVQDGIDLTRLLENAYISNRENRIVTL